MDNGPIILFQTQGDEMKFEVRLVNESVWLTTDQMPGEILINWHPCRYISMKRLLTLLYGAVLLSFSLSISSCSENEAIAYHSPIINYSPNFSPENPGTLILVYAVAANDLESSLTADLEEMIKAAEVADMANNTVVVYAVNRSGNCTLSQLVKPSGAKEAAFVPIKTYDRLPLSVDSERISEVIADVEAYFSSFPTKGLIFWSHGSGWTPFYGSLPDVQSPSSAIRPTISYSFGKEDYEHRTYECNITELAKGIPGNVFDFIWFDCCYMGGIETFYQLRNKASYIVAYPTEIYAPGLPYDTTLPYLLSTRPDLEGAALNLFKYYDATDDAVTVSVVRTAPLEDLAQTAAKIIDDTRSVSTSRLLNYATGSFGPFYDITGLLTSYPGCDLTLEEEMRTRLADVVMATYASAYDFHYPPLPIPAEKYSGISIHYFHDNGSQASEYYKTLDWYKATRK